MNINNKADPVFLPTGKSGFSELRALNKIYVDKTEMIWALARDSNYYFFSRPRRFGKTLLLSTFESLFKYGLRDFKGLDIEKLWTDDKTYPVIRLDFTACAKFQRIDEFLSKFRSMVYRNVGKAGLVLPEPDGKGIVTLVDQFESLITDNSIQSPVLLIDEYDAPINNHLENNELCDQVTQELAAFYSMLKRQSSYLRFLFITGICKHNTLNLFSSGNFIQDISAYPMFSTLTGYTEDELRHYFMPYIENAAKILNLSVEQCITKIKHHYDGFCFDLKASAHVLNPWSTLNFLSHPDIGFLNYWYNSAGLPTVLEQYIKEHSLKNPEEYGQDRVLSVDDLTNYRGLNGEFSDTVMLYQTGYLSIKSAFVEDMTVTLNYPNAEVSESMAKLYTEMVLGNRTVTSVIGYGPVGLFGTKSPETVVASLNKLFLSVDYKDYPLKSEATLRAYLQLYLKLGGINQFIETHNAKGRSDLEFKVQDRYWVIELKFAKEQDDPQKLLNEAVEQLKSRQYGEQNETKLQHIRLALVFSQKDRQFVENVAV
ncbi:MAG: ATP-binding protein [Succinatimonas sp.]|nr:ATP-binding protein [Succinatimonas sp.]